MEDLPVPKKRPSLQIRKDKGSRLRLGRHISGGVVGGVPAEASRSAPSERKTSDANDK